MMIACEQDLEASSPAFAKVSSGPLILGIRWQGVLVCDIEVVPADQVVNLGEASMRRVEPSEGTSSAAFDEVDLWIVAKRSPRGVDVSVSLVHDDDPLLWVAVI